MEKHELVDGNGIKTGKIITNIQARDAKNIPDGYYVDVVGVVIINNKNEVLLQKRSKNKRNNPGKWGICGGKIDAGESTIDAGIRETFEEIGVILNKDDFKLLNIAKSEKVYFTVYYVKNNIDINKCKIQEKEVEELKYFKINEIDELEREPFEWLDKLKELFNNMFIT